MTWIQRLQIFTIACQCVAIVFLVAAGVNMWRADRIMRRVNRLRRTH